MTTSEQAKHVVMSEEELVRRSARRAELWQKRVPELREILLDAGLDIPVRISNDKTALVGRIMLEEL